MGGTARKHKKDGKSIKYLESLRNELRSRSITSAMEQHIREQRHANEMERISASTPQYYDSLSDEEVEEDRAWGKFGESQFPVE